MINIYNDADTSSSTKYMTATFHRDEENEVVIDDVVMVKKFGNRMSKQRRDAVKSYLKKHAGREFEVKHGSVIELIFSDDKTKVRITFEQKQSK